VARAAIRRRLTWQFVRVVDVLTETARAKSIVLDAPDWAGHLAGQHVDVRLTAEDGYQAQRSYSIASAPEDEQLVLTVERLDDGEVSPYLTETLRPGDDLELRGPIGGYFVWREALGGPLFYSARSRSDVLYHGELEDYETTITLTREQPQGWSGRTGRVDGDLLLEAGWPPTTNPLVYVCGPTGFVEAVADALVGLGHESGRIRTERFGPT
jgi:ferredoxin-NADP reductase